MDLSPSGDDSLAGDLPRRDDCSTGTDLNFEDLLALQEKGIKIPGECLFNTDPLSWETPPSSQGLPMFKTALAEEPALSVETGSTSKVLPDRKLSKRERDKIYREKNKEKIKLRRQEAHQTQKNDRNGNLRRRYNARREEVRANRRKYRIEHHDSVLERESRYRELHREKFATMTREYRARKKLEAEFLLQNR